MNIAAYSRDKSLSELAKRVFNLPAKTSPAQIKRAEEALLQANPALHNLSDWSEGAPILVPRIPGLQASASTTLFDVASEMVTEEAARALAQLRKTVAEAASQNFADAEAVLKVLKSKPVKDSAAKLPDVKTRVTQIAATTKTREAEVKTAHTEFEKVLAHVAQGLKTES